MACLNATEMLLRNHHIIKKLLSRARFNLFDFFLALVAHAPHPSDSDLAAAITIAVPNESTQDNQGCNHGSLSHLSA
jgi:hypothetical protein